MRVPASCAEADEDETTRADVESTRTRIKENVFTEPPNATPAWLFEASVQAVRRNDLHRCE
jgi:hypothetical protein